MEYPLRKAIAGSSEEVSLLLSAYNGGPLLVSAYAPDNFTPICVPYRLVYGLCRRADGSHHPVAGYWQDDQKQSARDPALRGSA